MEEEAEKPGQEAEKPGQEAERLQKEMEEVEGQIQTTVVAEVKKTIHVQLRRSGREGVVLFLDSPLSFVICSTKSGRAWYIISHAMT